jgi:hypothetical protein
MLAGVNAASAADAKVGVDLDHGADRPVAVLDRTGGDARVAIHALLWIHADDGGKAIRSSE